jgi:hypothetical protein
MDVLRRSALLAIPLATIVAVSAAPAGAVTNWIVHVAAGSSAQASAQSVPSPPSPVTSTCSLVALQVTVSWPAVAHAASYTVYQSTTGANGTYTAVATGVATTSWTSPILVLGTYFYEVTATVGSNWVTAKSAASNGHTITLVLCT